MDIQTDISNYRVASLLKTDFKSKFKVKFRSIYLLYISKLETEIILMIIKSSAIQVSIFFKAGSGALSVNMLLVGIIENHKMNAYFRSG